MTVSMKPTLKYVVDDVVNAMKGVFAFNKMTPNKDYELLNQTVINEIDAVHKVYVERAEINREYVYVSTVAEQRDYTLDTTITEIFSCDYIIDETINQMKKIYPDDKAVAETIGNDGIMPSFYDDYTKPGILQVFPTPDVDGASFQLFVMKQIATLSEETDSLMIPWRCYDDLRDYVIQRLMIMYGFMTADKINMQDQLTKAKAILLASAERYRRYLKFKNPDIQPVVDGSI